MVGRGVQSPSPRNFSSPDHAVAISHNNLVENRAVGHVPIMYSKVFNKFLNLPRTSIKGKVIGPRMNRGGGYGLEVPMEFRLHGDDRAIEWAKKHLIEIHQKNAKIVRKVMK